MKTVFNRKDPMYPVMLPKLSVPKKQPKQSNSTLEYVIVVLIAVYCIGMFMLWLSNNHTNQIVIVEKNTPSIEKYYIPVSSGSNERDVVVNAINVANDSKCFFMDKNGSIFMNCKSIENI